MWQRYVQSQGHVVTGTCHGRPMQWEGHAVGSVCIGSQPLHITTTGQEVQSSVLLTHVFQEDRLLPKYSRPLGSKCAKENDRHSNGL